MTEEQNPERDEEKTASGGRDSGSQGSGRGRAEKKGEVSSP